MSLTRVVLPLPESPTSASFSPRVLKVNGTMVELTAKEFAILEYFLLNRGRLLSRSQILEHAWNHEFGGGGRNLVEVYVGRLRRKLVDAGAGDPFVTFRGAGYRYSVDDP